MNENVKAGMVYNPYTEEWEAVKDINKELGVAPTYCRNVGHEPYLPAPEGKHYAEFLAYHRSHPMTYSLLITLCETWIKERSWSSRIDFDWVWSNLRANICEVYHDEHTQFQVNNNYRSFYTRMVRLNNPDWVSKIEIRDKPTKINGNMNFLAED